MNPQQPAAGVVGGLVRAIQTRDPHLARHSAAVARFARDIAATVGMSAKQCELAHTAGLLHDVGRISLPDWVQDASARLRECDWAAICCHPDAGADLLAAVGLEPAVVEVVRCHHERVDGCGYPRMLAPHEIPGIAKLISVAEAYDAMTASGGYRTPMSPFAAVRELRRVAGTQLEDRYVEALVSLLTGTSIEYRQADSADLGVELRSRTRLRRASVIRLPASAS